MNLQTSRLSLSTLSRNDLSDIHRLHSLLETDEFNTLGIPASVQETTTVITNWLAAQHANPPALYIYCLHLHSTKQFIGLIALIIGKPNYHTAEVWYKLDVQYWKQGYATEALQQVLHFGFNDLKLHRIEAGCAVENKASVKVLEKAGMKREGLKRKKLPLKGEWKDAYFYAILDEDFYNNNQEFK